MTKTDAHTLVRLQQIVQDFLQSLFARLRCQYNTHPMRYERSRIRVALLEYPCVEIYFTCAYSYSVYYTTDTFEAHELTHLLYLMFNIQHVLIYQNELLIHQSVTLCYNAKKINLGDRSYIL